MREQKNQHHISLINSSFFIEDGHLTDVHLMLAIGHNNSPYVDGTIVSYDVISEVKN